jgi:hypothetical protein
VSCFDGKLIGMAYPTDSRLAIDSVQPGAVPAVSAEADGALQRSGTVKRLKPGSPGTRRLLQRYGRSLLCVRHRIDHATGKRFTTVELVVDERSGPPVATVWVRIGYGDTELRRQIKEVGGSWDAERKLWRVSRQAARLLKLQKRIVKDGQ